ncbi:uncharacterized protein LOC142224879 [Haematobia irritans]|uniref:uncharacterized protein LOC142224879 n=1 Tax=Haematobia irritans TaxID=7368 RepID=UPI003F50139A
MNNNLGPIINKSVIDNLNLNSRDLNLIHLNAQSLVPRASMSKLDELRNLFESMVFDVIGVSETWLNHCVLDSAIEIHGYRVYRNDRSVRRGGGVCMYIRSDIRARVVHEITDEGVAEGILVEVDAADATKILLGVLYLPYGGISQCENDLADYVARYNVVVLMGDYNIDLFQQSSYMRSVCGRMGLEIIHNCLPTHFNLCTQRCSLLDYYLVSDPGMVTNFSQFQFPALNSYHALISLSVAIVAEKDSEIFLIRDYRNFNLDLCERDFGRIDFLEMYRQDVNYQVEFMTQHVMDLFNRHVPLRRIRRSNPIDWMHHSSVRIACEKRDMAYRSFMESRSARNWQIYSRYRNRAKSVIRKRRNLFFQGTLQSSSQAGLWKRFESLGVAGTNGMGNDDLDVERCNDHFILEPPQNPPDLIYRQATGFREDAGFEFRAIDEFDVWDSLNRIKSKAMGADGISIRFLPGCVENCKGCTIAEKE